MEPSYAELQRSGELSRRADAAVSALADCRCCPHECGVDRLSGETGFCGVGRHALVASYGPHFGEEPPLVGRRGSGTIFFAGCNMRCDYCQNHDISQERRGHAVDGRGLADIMLRVQDMGCHNVNLVSPSHVVPQLLEALDLAAADGLRLPLVYNSGGYDSLAALGLLDGVVDIYMPDAKYDDDAVARSFSNVKDYPGTMRSALKEMHRQVGDLRTEDGIAVRGMVIRHLVLPEGLAGSEGVLRFIADELSRDSYVNIMDQYRPEWKVLLSPQGKHRPLARRISGDEYRQALQAARSLGLHRLAR